MTTKKWILLFYKSAKKDAKKIKSAGLMDKVNTLLDILENDPFQNPPPFEKLLGDLRGCYSRRINIQHRLVYEVDNDKHQIKIYRMFHHYE